MKNGYERDKFARETKGDPSLKPFRELTERREGGYFWENEILMQRHTDPVGGTIECILQTGQTHMEQLEYIENTKTHAMCGRCPSSSASTQPCPVTPLL